MKYNNPPTDALISALAPYILGGVVLYFLYKRGESTLPAKAAEVKKAAGEIKAGLPGFIADKLAGRSEAGYITQAEAERRAKALADLAKAKKAVSGFSPIIYGGF